MVKPAMFYLDIVYRISTGFNVPLAVYNVSGEYAMIKQAVKAGQVDDNEIQREIMTAFRRAGADLIITYHAREIARLL